MSSPRVPLFTLKPSIDVEDVQEIVEDYLEENPPANGEELLAEHLADPTPHPVYDDVPAGKFITYLQNGMA